MRLAHYFYEPKIQIYYLKIFFLQLPRYYNAGTNFDSIKNSTALAQWHKIWCKGVRAVNGFELINKWSGCLSHCLLRLSRFLDIQWGWRLWPHHISVKEKLQQLSERANNSGSVKYLSNGHIANVIPFATVQPNEMPAHEIPSKMANNKFYVRIK